MYSYLKTTLMRFCWKSLFSVRAGPPPLRMGVALSFLLSSVKKVLITSVKCKPLKQIRGDLRKNEEGGRMTWLGGLVRTPEGTLLLLLRPPTAAFSTILSCKFVDQNCNKKTTKKLYTSEPNLEIPCQLPTSATTPSTLLQCEIIVKNCEITKIFCNSWAPRNAPILF